MWPKPPRQPRKPTTPKPATVCLPNGDWLDVHQVAALLGLKVVKGLSTKAHTAYAWLPQPIRAKHTGGKGGGWGLYWPESATRAVIARGRPTLPKGWHDVPDVACSVCVPQQGARPTLVRVHSNYLGELAVGERLTEVESWVFANAGCYRYAETPSPATAGTYPLLEQVYWSV